MSGVTTLTTAIHQQAEAVAKEIAETYAAAWHWEDKREKADALLLAFAQRVQADAWEQAAQLVNSKSVPDFNSWLVGPAEVEHELRLRAST